MPATPLADTPELGCTNAADPLANERGVIAIKVQYPGIHEAIESDLDAAEVMYTMFSAMTLKGLDLASLRRGTSLQTALLALRSHRGTAAIFRAASLLPRPLDASATTNGPR